MNVAILGASDKPERYSYQALKMLKEYAHNVFPVNPVKSEIDGVKVYKSLHDIAENIDVLTLYVGADRLGDMVDTIIALKPRAVIFNPGTENYDVMAKVQAAGIKPVEACTLVLLRTNQFEGILS